MRVRVGHRVEGRIQMLRTGSDRTELTVRKPLMNRGAPPGRGVLGTRSVRE